MRVLVTGGSGDVGEYVVGQIKKKHEVIVVDLKAPKKNTDVEYKNVDLTDIAATKSAIDGMDVVVHLAAIPHPFNDPGDKVMGINMVTAYNVAEACKECKVKKVIYGGSDSSTGFGIKETVYTPEYLPMDGDHPCWPHESYSFTKYFGEIMFREYARAFKIPTISVRFLWVWLERDKENVEPIIRGEQGKIKQSEGSAFDWIGSYVMPEDVAEIVARSVDYDPADKDFPFEVFYAHAKENFNTIVGEGDTLKKAEKIWGKVPKIKNPDYYKNNPNAPFFDISNVIEKLGYTPQYDYKDYLK